MKKIFVVTVCLFFICASDSENVYVRNQSILPQYPKEREAWIQDRKAGPKNEEALRAAKKLLIKQLKESSYPTKDAGIASWTEIGPNNIGGRVRAIAPSSDSDVIFVGTAGGGILKGDYDTSNSTMSWTILDDFLSSLAISSLAIDYSASQDIIYAGTGEIWACRPSGCGDGQPGAGMLRSLDAGNTWNNILLPPEFTNFWITEIVVDHANPGTLYVLSNNTDQNGAPTAGDFGAIHKSTDYGNSWDFSRTTDNLGTTLDYVCDIKIDPSNSNRIIVSTWDGNTNGNSNIYRSTNGGIQFSLEQSALGERTELCYAPSATSTIYYSRSINGGGLVSIGSSTNSGASWSAIGNEDFDGQATYNNIIWVDPLDENILFAGGVDMYRSSDGGQSFIAVSDWRDYHNGLDVDIDGNIANSLHADHHVIVSAIDYDTDNRRVWFGNDGGVANTNEIDAVTVNSKWNLFSMSGYSVTQFVGGDISAGGTRFVGGAQDNSFSVGGVNGNWSQVTTADGGYCLIDKTNFNIIYTTTQRGNLHKSTDGGNSFCHIASFGTSCSWRNCASNFTSCSGTEPFNAINDLPAFYMPLEMDPSNSSRIYAGASRLWRSIDAGSTWNVKSPIQNSNGNQLQISSIDISPTNANTVIIGHEAGRVFVSNDIAANTPTWTRLDNNTPALPDSLITSVAINPSDNNEIMVSVAGYSQRSIWFTEDGGINWDNRSLDFDMQVNTITWHPENGNLVYIGTDIGVFASDNKGQDWSVNPLYSSSGTEGPAFVEVSELTWQKDKNRLSAFTHGRGLWLSNEINNEIYVNKNYTGVETGSQTNPFNTFTEAVDAAYPGAEIIFLSSFTHDEINSPLLVDKKLTVSLANGNNPVIIR